MFDLTA